MALVLVVDNDADSRRSLLLSLRALGHEAFGREDGRLGLDLLAQRPGFDVVISAFTLPKMNGADFLRAAALTVPSAAAVLIPDRRFDPRKHRAPGDRVVLLLPRPFSVEDLGQAVERAIGAGPVRTGEPGRSGDPARTG